MAWLNFYLKVGKKNVSCFYRPIEARRKTWKDSHKTITFGVETGEERISD